MKSAWKCVSFLAALAVIVLLAIEGHAEARAERVILVTYDGLRWQEMFGGLDSRLLNAEHGGMESPTVFRKKFGASTPEQRREALLPFMWNTIAKNGVILGDPEAKSEVVVTNTSRVSYPGYNELLTGAPDPRIRQNPRMANKNVTVLEWLHGKPAYAGSVAAYCSWDIFNFIIDETRVGFPVNAGWGDPLPSYGSFELDYLNRIVDELPHFWEHIRLDIYTITGAIEHLKSEKPKVLYVGLGETDDWGHDRRYDMYLDAAHRSDAYIRRLWETAQSMPEYKDKTALLISTDHGRGDSPEDWTSHNQRTEGSDRIWIAAMGAGIRNDGVVRKLKATQGQIAATVAALLGEDFNAAFPKAARPLPILTD